MSYQGFASLFPKKDTLGFLVLALILVVVLPLLPLLPELPALPELPLLPEDELGLGIDEDGMLLEEDDCCCSRQPDRASVARMAKSAVGAAAVGCSMLVSRR